jgi:hypothetical protein
MVRETVLAKRRVSVRKRAEKAVAKRVMMVCRLES